MLLGPLKLETLIPLRDFKVSVIFVIVLISECVCVCVTEIILLYSSQVSHIKEILNSMRFSG